MQGIAVAVPKEHKAPGLFLTVVRKVLRPHAGWAILMDDVAVGLQDVDTLLGEGWIIDGGRIAMLAAYEVNADVTGLSHPVAYAFDCAVGFFVQLCVKTPHCSLQECGVWNHVKG